MDFLRRSFLLARSLIIIFIRLIITDVEILSLSFLIIIFSSANVSFIQSNWYSYASIDKETLRVAKISESFYQFSFSLFPFPVFKIRGILWDPNSLLVTLKSHRLVVKFFKSRQEKLFISFLEAKSLVSWFATKRQKRQSKMVPSSWSSLCLFLTRLTQGCATMLLLQATFFLLFVSEKIILQFGDIQSRSQKNIPSSLTLGTLFPFNPD